MNYFVKSLKYLFNTSNKYFELGYKFEKSKNWEQAIINYKFALKLNPSKPLWHFRLGFVYEKDEKYVNAVEEYQSAIKLDPSKPLWHYRLGFVYEKDEKYIKAVEEYQSAIKLDPSKALWHFRLGSVYEKNKKFKESIIEYQNAIKLDSSKAIWHFSLAKVQFDRKNWLAAYSSIKSALKIERKNSEWFELLGLASEKILDWNTARYAFRRSYSISLKEAKSKNLSTPNLSSNELSRHINLSSIYKPVYAYCVKKSAELAVKLGVKRISVIELGVAGGNGLLALENYANIVSTFTGIKIDVYGFDTGEGLFEPEDYRDMPYFFAKGNYSINLDLLKNRLKEAKLILGDASLTFGKFLEDKPSPIGAISFDMDYYSATASVLKFMDDSSDNDLFLPRVSLYFDDVVGKIEQDYNEYTGELLAIKEFNDGNQKIKIAEDRFFRSLPLNFAWHHSTYTMHRFNSNKYGNFVSDHNPETLSLKNI